jgi:lipopolysaccharide transport system ATP-binding protein
MRPIIRVENLSKQYRIGARQTPYLTLRESIINAARSPLNWFQRNGHSEENTIWALKDVSFEVMPGEVVGIIGRNGAGKSTLLKILSHITEPTTGQIDLYGRVGSLLEVGTGFHAELSGRENIYLNGAILGMKRSEIDQKFDEIVAFAEVEKFLDTPVKHYSSGMYVRLAFAVAAHLQSEILVVDEVLAVGDAEFQKKCLGKMQDVAMKQGRTVLFVSHNLVAVRTLCARGIVLDQGQKCFDSTASDAIRLYSSDLSSFSTTTWTRPQVAVLTPLGFEKINLALSGKQPNLSLHCDLEICCWRPCSRFFVAVDVCDQALSPIMQILPESGPFFEGAPGLHRIQLEVQLPPLVPGFYSADFWVGSHYTTTLDYVRHALAFEVTESPSPDRSFPYSPDHGCIVPNSQYNYMLVRPGMTVPLAP